MKVRATTANLLQEDQHNKKTVTTLSFKGNKTKRGKKKSRIPSDFKGIVGLQVLTFGVTSGGGTGWAMRHRKLSWPVDLWRESFAAGDRPSFPPGARCIRLP